MRNYYAPTPECSIKHEPTDFFERQGFNVFHHSPFHYQIKRDGILMDYWPTTNRVMIFGEVFRASPERLVEKLNNGSLKIPASAKLVNCKNCGRSVFFARGKKGRRFPVELNGINHSGRCRGRK